MDRAERAQNLAAKTMELPAHQRASFLDAACAGDVSLRMDVETLVHSLDASRQSGDRPSAEGAATPTMATVGHRAPGATSAAAPVPEGPGTRIGPYKLLQFIGEGGFGTVFLAQQEKPISRKVALKITKLGMDTRQVIARFEAERQALAMMDHPNIARVLDAGATEAGRPYFVMELVKGDPITEYCDKNNLSIQARLELFRQVCDAVTHAHTKGIIHRDIKPSNILVSSQDGRPFAKVIDFGIAKATATELTEKTLFTEHKQLLGTPEYMSPEQAEGSLDIDTRTDVYSLGVTLYELLTGSTPFSSKELRSAAFGEIQRIIREVDPPRPSARLSQSSETIVGVAAKRQTEPSKLGTLVRGELDWIVMKALEKDRARRYESASSLAMDISRYLKGEAVTAAPPSRAYLLRKFVRRNRGAVLAGAAVALALVVGIVGTSLGLVEANRQRRAALAASAGEAAQRKIAQARLEESEATVKFLDDMLGAADPAAQGKDVTVRSVLDRAAQDLMERYADRPVVAARLHETLARTYLALGEYAPAEAHARASLVMYQHELGAENESTCQAVNSLAAVLIKMAKLGEVEPMLIKALKDHERLFGRRHEVTAMTMDNLAQLYTMMERRNEAITLATELLDIRKASMGPDRIETLSVQNTLAMLYADTERFDECEKLFEEAILESSKARTSAHPLSLELRANLGWAYYQDAMTHATSDPERYRDRLARARALDEEVLEERTRYLGEEHPETGNSRNNLASVYRELKMFDKSDELMKKDIEIAVRTLGENHPDTIVSIANMGNSLRGRAKYAEAVTFLERALKGARVSHPKDFQGTAFILGWYGSCLRALGRFEEGEPKLIEAHGIISRTQGERHEIAKRMALDLQHLYEDWDKAAPGKGHDAQAVEWKARAGGQPAQGDSK